MSSKVAPERRLATVGYLYSQVKKVMDERVPQIEEDVRTHLPKLVAQTHKGMFTKHTYDTILTIMHYSMVVDSGDHLATLEDAQAFFKDTMPARDLSISQIREPEEAMEALSMARLAIISAKELMTLDNIPKCLALLYTCMSILDKDAYGKLMKLTEKAVWK